MAPMPRHRRASGFDPSFDVDAPPRVGGNPTLWPIAFGMLGALGLGTVVFLQLNANRGAVDEARLTDPAPMAQPLSNAGVPPAPDMSAYLEPPPPPSRPSPLPVIEAAAAAAAAAAGTDAGRDSIGCARRRWSSISASTRRRRAGPAAPTGNPLDPAAVAGTMTGAANAGSRKRRRALRAALRRRRTSRQAGAGRADGRSFDARSSKAP